MSRTLVLFMKCSHLVSVMDKCVYAIILPVKATSVLLFILIKLIFFQLKMWLLHPPCLFLDSSHLIWCCKCSWLGSSSSKCNSCSLIVYNSPLFQELLLFCRFIFQMSFIHFCTVHIPSRSCYETYIFVYLGPVAFSENLNNDAC